MFYDVAFLSIQCEGNKFALRVVPGLYLRFLGLRSLEKFKGCHPATRGGRMLTLFAADCFNRVTVAEVFRTVCFR